MRTAGVKRYPTTTGAAGRAQRAAVKELFLRKTQNRYFSTIDLEIFQAHHRFMKTTQARHTITIGSDFQVVRYDAEYADMDNPQGAVVDEVFYLLAEDARGARKVWGQFDTLEAAEAAVEFAPAVYTWNDTHPAYGSEAYAASDAEADWAEYERANDGPLYGLRSTATPGYKGGF